MVSSKDLLRIIDRTLVDVLGNPAVSTVYDYLERTCGLKREEIPGKMDLFENEMEELLGSAAKTIVRIIKRSIREELET